MVTTIHFLQLIMIRTKRDIRIKFEVLWSLLSEIVVHFFTPLYNSFTKTIIFSPGKI